MFSISVTNFHYTSFYYGVKEKSKSSFQHMKNCLNDILWIVIYNAFTSRLEGVPGAWLENSEQY